MFTSLKKACRKWRINRTMKRITIEYLRNPNVNPDDYSTAIYTICMLTANIMPIDRAEFFKKLEYKDVGTELVNPIR